MGREGIYIYIYRWWEGGSEREIYRGSEGGREGVRGEMGREINVGERERR